MAEGKRLETVLAVLDEQGNEIFRAEWMALLEHLIVQARERLAAARDDERAGKPDSIRVRNPRGKHRAKASS